MNKAKKKYTQKCKQKIVTFYKCDAEILAFANSINFQAFVKGALTNALNDKLISGKATHE